jgi:mRNA interferase MazF
MKKIPVNLLPKRGEIWLVDLEPAKGDELKKQRPAVVISSNDLGALSIKLVTPLTTWNPSFQNKVWHVQIAPDKGNGLSQLSSADTLQTRSVSLKRFVRRLGIVNQETLEKLIAGLVIVIEY